jgi:hypothetical protein
MTTTRFARLAFATALVLGAATATAQHLLADFAGTWSVTVEGPQGPMGSELMLTQKGDTLEGKFMSEIGEAPISGMVKGDSVKIAFGLDMGGQQLSLQIAGALKDKDNMAGIVEAVGMGGFPFVATRKK